MGQDLHIREHFETITRHRLIVMKLCFGCGLYAQGLVHDLSKYSPTEFCVGAKYFQGTRSPNAAEREDKGFSEAWIHHKGRNKHHYEYWVDYASRRCGVPFTSEVVGPDGIAQGLIAAPMPTRYVVEMLCDRVAACKVYNRENYSDSSALEYFEREMSFSGSFMNADTAAFLLVLLEHLAQHGEKATLDYIRTNIVEPRFIYNEKAGF